MRNWESSSASALGSIVRMTGYWDAYKLDILMQSPMAMATAIMSSKPKTPSMPPSQDEAHSMIGGFTELTVYNSNNDLHLVQATSARFEGRMPDILEVETWRMVLHSMFLLSLLSSFLLCFFNCLDLSPGQMASAWVFTTSGDKSSGGGVSLCARSAEWLPYGTDRL
jgi:hypothetical protein